MLNTKPLLTTNQLLTHLQKKGVKFQLITLNDAETFLTTHNNYFRTAAYRKNFEKYNGGKKDGQYIDLDFAMLKDLCEIDAQIRQTAVVMALDIERCVRVKLLNEAEKHGEDGYAIVADYRASLSQNGIERLDKELERNRNNPYCGGIIDKYNNSYAIWAFVEVISFGTLIDFYRFCADRYSDKTMRNYFYLLVSVKGLRNAAAHNNCIIHNMHLSDRKHKPDFQLLQKIQPINKETRNKHLQSERMLQFVTLLYSYTLFVPGTDEQTKIKAMLNGLLLRMFLHIDYYKKHTLIQAKFEFIKKVVDILY